MAGNQNTPRSIAIKSAQNKAMGRVGGGNAKVSAQTKPGSKGVRVGVNNKATLPGNKTMSTAPGMKKRKN
jgi:hypothetical protein